MKRITWIDVAKGIGILLVVLAHSRFPTREVSWWINSFHMPLFFVVAGLCYDEARYPSLIAYLKRKSVALVYPYFTLSLMAVGLVACLYFGTDSAWTPIQMLKNMLGGATGGAFWFVTVLLEVELFYAAFARYVRHSTVRIVVLLGVSLMSAYLIPISLPYLIDTALVAVFFYAFGHFLRPHVFRLMGSKRVSFYSGFALVLTWGLQVALVVTIFRYKATFASRNFHAPTLYFLLAVLGVIGMLSLSVLSDRMEALVPGFAGRCFNWIGGSVRYLGRNTIIILAFHNFIGLCRSSWHLNGAVSQLLEFLILALLLWLLSGPLHFLVSFPSKQVSKRM